MKYQIGRIGRVIVVRFEDRDDLLGCITDLASREDIRSAERDP